MTKEEKRFEISRIITHHLAGDLGKDENRLLEEWLEESENNRKLFEQIKSEELLKEKSAAYDRINMHKALYEFMVEKAKSDKFRKRRLMLKRFKYAAVIALPLFLAGWLFYEQLGGLIENATINYTDAPRVMLTLASGESVELTPAILQQLQQNSPVQIRHDDNQMELIATQSDVKEEALLHTISVPRGGEFYLVLSDGTKVWLNAETHFTFPLVFTGEQRNVYLKGEAYFEVAGDSLRRFEVGTKHATINVYGTSFNVMAYPDEETTVATLVTGAVGFRIESTKEEVRMEAGEQVVFSSGEWNKKTVDPSLFTSWKEGRVIFTSTRLEDMLYRINRWYDVEIIFASDAARELVYSGEVRKYEDIREILDIIESTQSVRFKTENGRVIVY